MDKCCQNKKYRASTIVLCLWRIREWRDDLESYFRASVPRRLASSLYLPEKTFVCIDFHISVVATIADVKEFVSSMPVFSDNSKTKYPLKKCMFKVNYSNTRTMCRACSKLTIKTPERHHRYAVLPHLLTMENFDSLLYSFNSSR